MLNVRRESEAPALTRRSLLQLGALMGIGVLLGPISCATAPSRIRRETGLWSQAEVEFLAKEMLAETQLNDVAYAGAILLDNQRGIPSVSKMSPIFAEDKIKLRSVVDTVHAPMMMAILPDEKNLVFDLVPKTTGALLKISVPTSLHIKEIQLNHRFTKDYSDFITKFFMAKEILNASAFDKTSSYIAYNGIYNKYEKPSSTQLQNAIQTGAIKGSFGEIPAALMADMWAHFLLVPDYLRAMEQGRFTSEELASGHLDVFEYGAQVFRDSGILNRNDDGKYEWTKDRERFFAIWIDFGTVVANAKREDKKNFSDDHLLTNKIALGMLLPGPAI